jgi:hypothetical protein
MQDLNKLVDVAIEYRIAKLKAREQGIIGITDCGGKREEFQYHNEEDFARLIKDREYTVQKFPYDYKYQYTGIISGLTFICLSNKFLFEGDEKRLVEDV